jgi:hypothetical protein
MVFKPVLLLQKGTKYVLLVFLCMMVQCKTHQQSEKSEPVFIYDSNGLFEVNENSNDSLDCIFFTTKETVRKFYDTLLISENYKIYTLDHYVKYADYMDTSFVKHKSYIDSIVVFDYKWLTNEEKLDSFWMPASGWRQGGIYDTTKIYLILPLENTDSVLFRQVHRWFHQTL